MSRTYYPIDTVSSPNRMSRNKMSKRSDRVWRPLTSLVLKSRNYKISNARLYNVGYVGIQSMTPWGLLLSIPICTT